jgi:hypothetical protein
VPDPLASCRTRAVSRVTSIVTALAEETHAPIALVKSLYDREVAVLDAQASGSA